MTNRAYDILSKAQRWLPAVGVFYLALSKIWTLPFGGEVNETVMALAALLAATLEVSSVRYFKGERRAEAVPPYEDAPGAGPRPTEAAAGNGPSGTPAPTSVGAIHESPAADEGGRDASPDAPTPVPAPTQPRTDEGGGDL